MTYSPTHIRTMAAVRYALEQAGVPWRYVDPGFIQFWLARGKSPEEIVAIACGTDLFIERSES